MAPVRHAVPSGDTPVPNSTNVCSTAPTRCACPALLHRIPDILLAVLVEDVAFHTFSMVHGVESHSVTQ
jgi:hypothetical protein